MTEFYLTPTAPFDSDNEVDLYMNIHNTILWAGWNLQYQYDNDMAYMNYKLGAEPAPNYLSWSDMHKFSGVYLYINPNVDFSLKQYLVIFKVVKALPSSSNTIEIYHNGDKVATEVLEPGDDRFVIVVDGEDQSSTNLFFRAASPNYFWFKEIEVQII